MTGAHSAEQSAATSTPNATADLLLTGGTVITVDDARRVFDPGAVAVVGDRISFVGPLADAPRHAARRIDCAGRAVIPGLIDCHTHLFQGLARGIGEGMSLWPWLRDFMWPYAAAITPAEAVAAARLGAIEAVRAGTTTVCDNHYAPADLDTTLAVAAAIESVGLRGVVARGSFGALSEVARTHGLADVLFRYPAAEELAITRAAIQARPPGSRVGVWPSPINVIYNEQELVRDLVGLAHELGTGWHTHCSEARADPDIYLEAYGVRPVTWLAREGLLGAGATVAHGIWLDDAEVSAVGATATGISYNPTSNQYLASGALRLRDLRAAGAVVGLGTDGPGCGHRQDLFEQIKQAMLVQRLHTLDPTSASVEEAFELATREGARYLGITAGVLEPGRLADLAVVDLSAPHLQPRNRAVATLGYAARGADVVLTVVGGRAVYESGACTLVDERDAVVEARARADELVSRAGLEPLRRPWVAAG